MFINIGSFARSAVKKKILLFLCIFVFAIIAIVLSYYYTKDYVFYKVKQQKLENTFTKSKQITTYRVQVNKPVPTKLIIPKINIKQYVIYAKGNLASQMKALKSGPVHYGGTALPGQNGNILIGGHYVWYTFKYLNKLKINDTVKLEVPGQVFKYKIIKTKIVYENRLEEVKRYGSNKKRLLTLYTCVYPSWKTKKRFLAIGEQVYP